MIKLNAHDEDWLLSSVASAWNRVREDAQAGYLNIERDLVASFYHWFRPSTDARNCRGENGLGDLRVLTEVTLWNPSGQKGDDTRYIDLALVRVDASHYFRVIEIIAQFEFKYKVLYIRSNVESDIRWDIRRLGDGNDGWKIVEPEPDDTDEKVQLCSAKTTFSFFGLVVDDWDTHVAGSSKIPNNNGILHPNGTERYSKPTEENPLPFISNHKEWLRYFEMHGPYSEDPNDPDWKKWGVFEIDRAGKPIRIQ